jgi:hypothetical protein
MARRAEDIDEDPCISEEQAREAAYRFVARYYDNERVAPIRRLLGALSLADDHPQASHDGWATWQACIQETVDGAPLPVVPLPWD